MNRKWILNHMSSNIQSVSGKAAENSDASGLNEQACWPLVGLKSLNQQQWKNRYATKVLSSNLVLTFELPKTKKVTIHPISSRYMMIL